MNQATSFVISEFTNPSGEIAFRVAGWLAGRRVRKNFPTRAEAEAERQVLEIQSIQKEIGIRTAVTRLTDEQLHEAEAIFRRLAEQPRPLGFYMDYALTNYREPERQKSLADAITEYVAAKEREFSRLGMWPTVSRTNRRERSPSHHIVIWDQAGFHQAIGPTAVPRVRILSLPPYSPELYPVEKLGSLIKGAIANTLFPPLRELEDEICEELRPLWTEPARVRQLIGNCWLLS